MTSNRSKSTSSSENGMPGSLVSTVAFLPHKTGKEKQRASNSKSCLVKVALAALPILLLLALVIVLVILLTSGDKRDDPKTNGLRAGCSYSEEAKRIGLNVYLEELFHKHYELMPEKIGSKRKVTFDEITKHYRPYDPSPSAVKNFTDEVRRLYEKMKEIIGKSNGSRLKLRENKAMYLAQYLLKHSFDWGPYERDYYTGDWMFEPNLYCWQPICGVLENFFKVIPYFKPGNLPQLKRLEELFEKHNETISRYIENLKLGVATGIVRSVESCKAGIIAIKRNYYQFAVHNETGIFNEQLGKKVLSEGFTSKITPEMNATWYETRGEGVYQSLRRFLLVYLGEPLTRLIRYLEEEHIKYCYDGATGIAKLPLNAVYADGVRDPSRPTTGSLPNGDKFNASTSYKRLLSFFTSTSISPDKLRAMGYKKLEALLSEVKNLAKQYTGIKDEGRAVVKFREVLISRDMFFNRDSFPINESGDEAYMKCTDTEGAHAFCPMRWKALQKWINYTKHVAQVLTPKIKNLFYDSNSKKTTPSCGISVKGDYKPGVCFHGYEMGCPASQTLPFFMNDFGPKYTEFTTTSHEQLPGHHLEVQGFNENFQDLCGDAISWISAENYIPPFTEGWATYVEHPLMAKDTNSYVNVLDKNILLQKYGMMKYQILAALRSVLDSGVNYFGMTREEATNLYAQYAWDESDLAVKDITRFQNTPAIAMSYMIGHETFVKLRQQAQRELGESFSMKEFHYQILRQGEIPLEYLEEHISRFIKCKKGSSERICPEILS